MLLTPRSEHPVSQVRHPRELAIASTERMLEVVRGVATTVERQAGPDAKPPFGLGGSDGMAFEGAEALHEAALDLEAWATAREELEEPRELDFDPREIAVELRVRASAIAHAAQLARGREAELEPEQESELALEQESEIALKTADEESGAEAWRAPLEDLPSQTRDHPLVLATRAVFDPGSGPPGDEVPELKLDGLGSATWLASWFEATGKSSRAQEVRAWQADREDDAAEKALGLAGLLVPLGIGALVALLITAARGRSAWRVAELDLERRSLSLANAWPVFVLYWISYQLLLPLFGGHLSGVSTLAASLPLVLGLFAVAHRTGHDLPGMLGLEVAPGRFGRVFLTGLIGALLAYAGLLSLFVIVPFAGTSLWENPVLDLALGVGDAGFLAFLAEAALWAPLFEEIGFRGLLFSGLRTRLRFGPAALLSAAAFAYSHPYDPSGQFAILWIGFLLAWLRERTGSLVPCILAHSLYNATQFALLDLFRG
jgi:membrane protease YdiL (CAAX protease family)